ncbi:hypothetical protein CBR_g8768 [Chara braunii]|uniref:Uncharacterized protein n=1 Tax=Chara braunii TaxID=69332 RepID=A0A388KMR2_CHABU|nr:hypothetical protein CBR_g8768 [Chara braunii]|eukprot:GBG71349.1 hypothetical protein CBR_g8768 [Chara braunii]
MAPNVRLQVAVGQLRREIARTRLTFARIQLKIGDGSSYLVLDDDGKKKGEGIKDHREKRLETTGTKAARRRYWIGSKGLHGRELVAGPILRELHDTHRGTEAAGDSDGSTKEPIPGSTGPQPVDADPPSTEGGQFSKSSSLPPRDSLDWLTKSKKNRLGHPTSLSVHVPIAWQEILITEPTICYKMVAAVEGKLVSVFDGRMQFSLGRISFAPRGLGGWSPLDCSFFVYATKTQAKLAKFPGQSKHLLAPKVILSVQVFGRGYVSMKAPYKMAFQFIKPIGVLSSLYLSSQQPS